MSTPRKLHAVIRAKQLLKLNVGFEFGFAGHGKRVPPVGSTRRLNLVARPARFQYRFYDVMGNVL
ncbi:MAG: hypothetical protein O2795_17770, partial [Acidobacteria bacterium]|nr:hypothetical protein [Acidobacteriota bacterium]